MGGYGLRSCMLTMMTTKSGGYPSTHQHRRHRQPPAADAADAADAAEHDCVGV